MDNWFKWLWSVILGGLATFFGQYGLFIVLVAEAISISENLYLINPESFPRWIARMLKVAKGKIEKEGSDYDETGNDDNTTK
jgi:hypothetical protein